RDCGQGCSLTAEPPKWTALPRSGPRKPQRMPREWVGYTSRWQQSDPPCKQPFDAELRRTCYFVRNELSPELSISRSRVFGVKTFPLVERINFFISFRRTPKPRPAIHAITS